MNVKTVEINNLNYTYSDGKKALDNVSLDIYQGETVGIIGPNGAGKTTLLLHLNGIFKSHNESSIKISGLQISAKTIQEIRKKVGIVFENPDDQLFMPTVFEDIAFGLLNLGKETHEIEKKVKEILKSFEMEEYEKRSSHHLSYGEKKRVALASVIVMEPEILVMDEPTSNLDPAGRRELSKLIKGLNHTKIISGHDMNMIKELCSRVIIINNGRKIEEGTPDKIFSNHNLLLNNRLI